MSFSNLNLHPHLIKTTQQMGFTNPTPVQEQSIPHAVEGLDVMACAQTGTGKTAAFTLPIIHRLLSNPRTGKSSGPRALVLTPTRELAEQVFASVKSFSVGTTLKAGVVVGGVGYGPQISMLQRPLDILIATPGRLIDHMNERRVNLAAVEVVVLDEADRMLDMGFVKPVESIMAPMPKERQTLLFSATFEPAVEKLAKKFLKDPVQVKLAAATQQHTQITQAMFYALNKDHKIELLKSYLEEHKVWQLIVFMKTKHSTEKMAKTIAAWGYNTAALHGDMKQNARKRVIDQMHKGTLQVLVATDVAARGLDVKDLSHVVNFDLPQVAEDYIHRIGRTGRAGAEGDAVSLVTPDEASLLADIEKLLGQTIQPLNEALFNIGIAAKKGSGRSKSKPKAKAKPAGFSKGNGQPRSEFGGFAKRKEQGDKPFAPRGQRPVRKLERKQFKKGA